MNSGEVILTSIIIYGIFSIPWTLRPFRGLTHFLQVAEVFKPLSDLFLVLFRVYPAA